MSDIFVIVKFQELRSRSKPSIFIFLNITQIDLMCFNFPVNDWRFLLKPYEERNHFIELALRSQDASFELEPLEGENRQPPAPAGMNMADNTRHHHEEHDQLPVNQASYAPAGDAGDPPAGDGGAAGMNMADDTRHYHEEHDQLPVNQGRYAPAGDAGDPPAGDGGASRMDVADDTRHHHEEHDQLPVNQASYAPAGDAGDPPAGDGGAAGMHVADRPPAGYRGGNKENKINEGDNLGRYWTDLKPRRSPRN
jgi:hypothetical protein